MAAQTVWHGTQTESFELVEAIARNCACVFGPMNVRTSTCEPHQAMVSDQRFLDGLLYVRRMFARDRPAAGLRVILNGE